MKGKLAAAVLMAALLAGCQSEVYSDVDERSATEMVAVLAQAGIDASRTMTGEGKYSISVDRSNLSAAFSELQARGLPRKLNAGFSIFKPGSVVDTPEKERVMYNTAVSQELESSISRIAGVADARVHLDIPETPRFAKVTPSPRASVFIYKLPSANLDQMVPTIKNLVMHAVNGLDYDNVEVAMFDESVTTVAPSITPRASSMMSSLAVLAGLVIGFMVLLRIMRKTQPSAPVRADQIGNQRGYNARLGRGE